MKDILRTLDVLRALKCLALKFSGRLWDTLKTSLKHPKDVQCLCAYLVIRRRIPTKHEGIGRLKDFLKTFWRHR